MSHLDHLERLVGSLREKRVLDMGCGEGGFAVDAALAGADVSAIDIWEGHIAATAERTQQAGVRIFLEKSPAEHTHFPDSSFDFLNISEVLEHVEDPDAVLHEAYRVLRTGGSAYLSVPNRFGVRDPHFHMLFINWMPRFLAEFLLSISGRQKSKEEFQKGRNRLSEMHYMRYGQIRNKLKNTGFEFRDIRSLRLETEIRPPFRFLARFAYWMLRPFYFDTFHLLLVRPEPSAP